MRRLRSGVLVQRRDVKTHKDARQRSASLEENTATSLDLRIELSADKYFSAGMILQTLLLRQGSIQSRVRIQKPQILPTKSPHRRNNMPSQPLKSYYLAGKGVKHSIAPSVHQTVADHFNLPWKFHLLDIDTVEELITTFRKDDFVGGVVTMPYKKSIMKHLDELDGW